MKCPVNIYCRGFVQFEIRETCIYYCKLLKCTCMGVGSYHLCKSYIQLMKSNISKNDAVSFSYRFPWSDYQLIFLDEMSFAVSLQRNLTHLRNKYKGAHCRIGFSEETHANCAKIPTNTGSSLIQETKKFQRKF